MSDSTALYATLTLTIAMFLPFAVYRLLFAVYKPYFERLTSIRQSTGWNTHHHHLGLLILILTTIVGLDWRDNYWQAFFTGLGWGFVLDEVTSSLLLPGNRPVELQVYEQSLSSTITLLLFLFAVIWLITVTVF